MSVGGVHGAELYAALSGRDLHRPTDPSALAAEVRRLHGTGLKPADIAAALRLALPAVQTMLGEPLTDPSRRHR